MRNLRSALRLSILLGVLVLVPHLDGPHAQSQASFKVTVLTKHGHPVRGVALTLAAEDRIREGVTNAKGEFEFGGLPELRYVLDATYLDVPIASIPDIQVRDLGSSRLSITLDPPGGYLVVSPRGDCNLRIAFVPDRNGKVAYEERHGSISVTGTVGVLNLHLERIPDQVLVLSIFRAEEVKVPFSDGQPVAEVRSDDRGEYHIDDLKPGKYRMRVSYGLWRGTTMEFWVARENTTQIGPITLAPPMNDDCGLTEVIPFDDPVNPAPEPELIPPNRQ
jgi:hypothetical protein